MAPLSVTTGMERVYDKLKSSVRRLQARPGAPTNGGEDQLAVSGVTGASLESDRRAVEVLPATQPRFAGTRSEHDKVLLTSLAVRLPYARSSLPFDDGLTEGAASQVVADLTKFHAKERVQLEAMREERRRFARDIHDGILQALTGAAMQLEAAFQLIDSDPEMARTCVKAVSELLASEQRELRSLIRKTESAADRSLVGLSELASVLESIRDRFGQQWGLSIELTIGGHGQVARSLSDDIYSIVQEALANAARHARAKACRASLVLLRNKVCITVVDDGGGFPFHGRYDLPALIAREIGPVSLRERIAARHGALTLVSSLSGSKLEISLPLKPS